MIYRITLALLIVSMSCCKILDGYERRYSVGVVDEYGRRADIGITLVPRAPVVVDKKSSK